MRPNLRQLKGITILDDYSLSHTLQIRPENTPGLDLPTRKIKFPRPDNQVVLKSNTTVGKSMTPEIPRDLPVSLVLDKPELAVGKSVNNMGVVVHKFQFDFRCNLLYREREFSS